MDRQHAEPLDRLLVDATEVARLRTLLERAKPPYPGWIDPTRYDRLLSTPSRYPPLEHGSRFGSRDEPGIFYGACTLEVALAEIAYYSFRFRVQSRFAAGVQQLHKTAFDFTIDAARGVDLCESSFRRHHHRICAPESYAYSQPLGAAMRAHGVQAFCFPSARDLCHRRNIGVLDIRAFRNPRREPTDFIDLSATLDDQRIIFRELRRSNVAYESPISQFTRPDGTLAMVNP